jgi:RNA polymerase sigma-70 factor (ECF subfamily)
LVNRYVDAWERCDVESFASMLAEDATFAMPPLASWYRGRDGIRTWASLSPMSGAWRWRTVFTRANGQPALAFYSWDDAERGYLPFALNVLTFRGAQIVDVTAFIVRSTEATDPEAYERFPDQPFDPQLLASRFERFGLPARLD